MGRYQPSPHERHECPQAGPQTCTPASGSALAGMRFFAIYSSCSFNTRDRPMRKVTNLCFPEPARGVRLLDIWYLKGGFAMANYLAGQMLIAMPQMDDKRFRNSVILICSHDSDAAMGLIINQPMDGLYLDELAEQIGIGTPRFCG
ncbi:MAG TPA: hypothetical protein DEQ75_05775, partial [Alphaproteobacteria bacterium]|nr:hypothetical protein [Alphaproteobacteria bacterium]